MGSNSQPLRSIGDISGEPKQEANHGRECPLKIEYEQAIGSLCLLGRQPRMVRDPTETGELGLASPVSCPKAVNEAAARREW